MPSGVADLTYLSETLMVTSEADMLLKNLAVHATHETGYWI
ncbi:MAG TPA: hypothetical protein VF910_02210 [Candidatus Bathyarchaeia archaeon]